VSVDWKEQLKNRISSVEALSQYVHLTPEEIEGIEKASSRFRWAVTPYYASLMARDDPNCPIRRQAIPSPLELYDVAGVPDPLLEEQQRVAPGVLKIYPDRVAFLVTNRCPTLCRHCLRKRLAGTEDRHLPKEQVEAALDYLRATPEIRDVLLTGGDALMLEDEPLEELLTKLREIPHIEIIRLGTRTPCTLPQRITPELCRMLEKFHPLYLNTQFNHPKEITADAAGACDMLSRAGIPLGNQSVLLKGINDDVKTMKALIHRLLQIRVRPYYLYQCQLLSGTAHFRTSIETGMYIMRKLRGFTSGLGIPTYVLDTPYGKTPLNPTYALGRKGDCFAMRTWDGHVWRELNPLERPNR
jgi:lysine 2,3-aminomutase